MIAKVIVDCRSKNVDRMFDYLVPEEMADSLQIGSRVLVPFSSGNRGVEGFCVGFSEKSTGVKLKSIIKSANDIPAFDADMLEVIEWMRKKYLASYLDIIRAVVPAGTALKSEEWIILEIVSLQRSSSREKIIEIIQDNGGGIEYTTLKERMNKDVSSVVRSMIKDGVLRREYRSSAAVSDKKIRYVRLTVSGDDARAAAASLVRKAPVQSRMLDILASVRVLPTVDLQKMTNGSSNAVNALEKKGLCEIYEAQTRRDPYKGRTFKNCRRRKSRKRR